jgi:hypothetical protein
MARDNKTNMRTNRAPSSTAASNPPQSSLALASGPLCTATLWKTNAAWGTTAARQSSVWLTGFASYRDKRRYRGAPSDPDRKY